MQIGVDLRAREGCVLRCLQELERVAYGLLGNRSCSAGQWFRPSSIVCAENWPPERNRSCSGGQWYSLGRRRLYIRLTNSVFFFVRVGSPQVQTDFVDGFQ
jgi:hypothetical protein